MKIIPGGSEILHQAILMIAAGVLVGLIVQQSPELRAMLYRRGDALGQGGCSCGG